MSDKRLQEIRERMHRRDPRCHYCSVVTILPKKLAVNRRNIKATPTMATIDHLFSRLNPLRQNAMLGFPRYVLACVKCNCERAQKEIAEELTLHELHQRSGRFPQETKTGTEPAMRKAEY